jgi:hypothetical protein
MPAPAVAARLINFLLETAGISFVVIMKHFN